MTLLLNPVMVKFFSNKIESSQAEWRAYILEIANIFMMFDNEIYDRSLLGEMFETISGRSAYTVRDASNFRDEFGAYGSYLGIFRLEHNDGVWRIKITEAAKQFLCSAEPDVSAFCTLQLALYQYPNAAGCVIQHNGNPRVQKNISDNTKNEILHSIRIAPFRLVCRCVVAMHEILGMPLNEIQIDYKTIFMLFNDDSINTTYNPPYQAIVESLNSYTPGVIPVWVTERLTNFKRNFHIFEQTGLFSRTKNGLCLRLDSNGVTYQQIKTIAEINSSYNDFEPLYNTFDDAEFYEIFASQSWGKYYDGATLPLSTIQTIAGISIFVDSDLPVPTEIANGNNLPVSANIFPALTKYENHKHSHSTEGISKFIDIQSSIVAREKANREHERMIHMLNAHLILIGAEPMSNLFIDLFVNLSGQDYLFEVKTTTDTNYLSQIRKGVSQLYEYRFRHGNPAAKLCLVLQNKPKDKWVIDYLIYDRGINVCWLVDTARFECPASCYEELKDIQVIYNSYE